MNRINVQMKINSPKEKVWDVIADIGRIQKWAPIVTYSDTITPSNRGVGCERTCEIKDVGSIHEKVIEWNEENAINTKYLEYLEHQHHQL